MKNTIFLTGAFFSSGLTVILLFLLSICYGFATIIDLYFPDRFDQHIIYGNPLFFILILFSCINFLAVSLKRFLSYEKNHAMSLMHLSFILMVGGQTIKNAQHSFGKWFCIFGYIMMLISLLMIFFTKDSRLRNHIKRLKVFSKNSFWILLLSLSSLSLKAETQNMQLAFNNRLPQEMHIYTHTPVRIQDNISTFFTESTIQPEINLVSENSNKFIIVSLAYLFLGFFMMISIYVLMHSKKNNKIDSWKNILDILMITIGSLFFYHTLKMAEFWIQKDYYSIDSVFDCAPHVAWYIMFASLFFVLRSPMVFSFASFFAGLMMLIQNFIVIGEHLSFPFSTQITVGSMLSSSFIMCGFGFFSIGFMINIYSVILLGRKNPSTISFLNMKELRIINEIALNIGVLFVMVGTFACIFLSDIIPGLRWTWSAQQVWALIALLAYGVVTHSGKVDLLSNDLAFNMLGIYAYIPVIICYYGIHIYETDFINPSDLNHPFITTSFFLIYILITIFCNRALMLREESRREKISFKPFNGNY